MISQGCEFEPRIGLPFLRFIVVGRRFLHMREREEHVNYKKIFFLTLL